MNEANILYSHLTAGAIFAYLMSHLQQWQKLPWINKDSKRINALVRLAMSGVATLGIHWTWAGSWGAGRTLTISIPAASVLLHTAFTWFGQYATQHGWEKVFNIGGRVDPQVMEDFAEAVAAKLAAPPA